MKLLDQSFESCVDLQELFQPLSQDLVGLQLSSGRLKGRDQAWGCLLYTSDAADE